jgi:DNA-binding response OmpR family regulator
MTDLEKNYRVWVFDDSKSIRKYMEATATAHLFEIVLWLETFPQALSALESFDETQQLKPDAILVDGNLTHNSKPDEDGKVLVQKAREKGLLTVAFTDSKIDADINPPEKLDWPRMRKVLNKHLTDTTSSQT